MPLIFDSGVNEWIAVKEDGITYDDELQQVINLAAQSSGVAGRDPGFSYRPNLTAAGTYDFAHVPAPQITLENLSKATNVGQGGISDAARLMMQDIRSAATNMEQGGETNPITMAIKAQQAAMAAAPEDDLSAQYRALYTDQTEDPAESAVSTGRTHGELSSDETMMWDASAMAGAGGWIPNPNYDPAKDQLGITPNAESEQYLADLMAQLNSEGIPPNYEEHIRQLATDFQGGRLTQEQVQTYIDQLGTIAISQLTDTNVASVEQFLDTVYASFSPLGPGGKNPWLRKLGYTPQAQLELDAAASTADLTRSAETATDVNSFIEEILTTSMEGGATWEEALNRVSTILFDNKSIWATANNGLGIPGLSGRIGDLNSPEDVKRWLYDAYGTLDNDTKTRLVEDYPNKGPDLSSDYTVFAKAPAPVEGQPGDQPVDQPGGLPGGLPGGQPGGSPAGTPIPTSPSSGIYDPFFEDAQRPFSTVYDPYTATQPGYNMPGIQQAYASARSPLSTQYSMQLPDLQVPGGEIGLDPKYQSADEFLRSLTAGTGQILRGGDLYSRLQDISGALSVDPMALGMDRQAELYQSRFGTTPQQKAAFAQPFLMATRGSPEARSALNLAINQAAQQFDYQNPEGVPMAGGGKQGFLGWAMENNLLGINDMFASQQAQRETMNPAIPSDAWRSRDVTPSNQYSDFFSRDILSD